MYRIAEDHLKSMFGENAVFREGQWEAISLILSSKRALLVQKTGWGKSIIYFIATKMNRQAGSGPTVLVSPLLSLMRNQLINANKLGLVAESINSQNQDSWDEVFHKLEHDECDLLMISPEQLGNKKRIREILAHMYKGIGMFVVDEAHCISDWGHDFRPDYRRIVSIVQTLPASIPVIATTATASERVVEDVAVQLGRLEVHRGSLMRESLRLQVISLKDQADRLAWLAENVPKFTGAGIIYCLTVADSERVANWLRHKGIDAKEYNAKLTAEERVLLETAFMKDQVKCLVATVALGMGYDKPNIGFVVHYQRPGNIVSYYQQIGRAGRSLESAYAILLNGKEDDEIQNYFIRTAFPTEREMNDVLSVIEDSDQGLTKGELMAHVNIQYQRLEKCLKFLEVENILDQDDSRRYFRTLRPWEPNIGKSTEVTRRRYAEVEEMKQFVELEHCYMKFIAEKLDDPYAKECGRCRNCVGKDFFKAVADPALVIEASAFLRAELLSIEPRKMWPPGVRGSAMSRMAQDERIEEGRVLCYYGDAGWGRLVQEDKYVHDRFREELVDASAELIRNWLGDRLGHISIAYVPSLVRPDLVRSFANRVAERLGRPSLVLLSRKEGGSAQKEMENSAFQCRNALEVFSATGKSPDGPVLLIDDMVDSKWTLTVCGYLLKKEGCAAVYPFALASTAGMGDRG